MASPPSSWPQLPEEILAMIKNLLHSPSDITRFRSVCPSWRSSTPPFKNSFPFPDLFLENNSQTHNNLQQITIYCFEPLVHPSLSSSSSSSSSSSPTSWFVAVLFSAGKQYFLNALTSIGIDSTRFDLPKELNLCDFRITEVKKLYGVENMRTSGKALFIDTQYYDETLLAVCDFNLVFFKLEGSQWVFLKDIDDMRFTDVELYQGRVWGVDPDGRTVVFSSSLDIIEIAPRLLPEEEDDGSYYFIESSGDLFLVEFNEDMEKGYRTLGKDELFPMKAYKLAVVENVWVEVKDLDDRVFVFALEFPWCFSLASRQDFAEMKNSIVRSAICSDEYDSEDTYVPMTYSVWDIRENEYDRLSSGFRKLFWPPPPWFTI